MFNKVVLVGSITRDIEIRYSQSGSAIGSTAIATNRKFTKDGTRHEEVCFIDITFFGRSAEVANQYLRKGSKILVEGRIKFDQWTAQDGSNRSKHSVIVEMMQMLDSKNNDGQEWQQPRSEGYASNGRQYGDNHTDYQTPHSHGNQSKQMPQQQQAIPDMDIDEIPFGYIGLQYPMCLHVI